MKRRLITHTDHARLNIIYERSSLKSKRLQIMEQFYDELRAAATFRPEHISSRVVTMNSRVLLKDLINGEELQLTLTYPHNSKDEDKKVSVFAPPGMALLGRVIGDEVIWKISGRTERYQILKVTYQPEAVGDFYL